MARLRTPVKEWQGPDSVELMPALFLHIQKTAGTSIVSAAREHCGDANMITHGDYMSRTSEELADVPFISGHFGYDFARQLMGERYSFTFLRKPVDRVLFLLFMPRAESGRVLRLQAGARVGIGRIPSCGSKRI